MKPQITIKPKRVSLQVEAPEPAIVQVGKQGVAGPPGLDGTREPSHAVSGSTQLAVNQAYLVTGSSLQLLNLPLDAAIGDFLSIYGTGTGLFRVTQNASQSVQFNADTTTPGITGRLEAVNINARLKLICSGAGTWIVDTAIGNFEVS